MRDHGGSSDAGGKLPAGDSAGLCGQCLRDTWSGVEYGEQRPVHRRSRVPRVSFTHAAAAAASDEVATRADRYTGQSLFESVVI